MKKLRIGTGSGGCSYERLEPAEELIEQGNIRYIVFECLAERTMAEAQAEKQVNPKGGYNPMLEERLQRLLPLAVQNEVKIVSNMGGANTPMAVCKSLEIAGSLKLKGLSIAAVEGDDILDRIREYYDLPLCESGAPLSSLDGRILCANAYLDGNPICSALDGGARLVITGRVADPALFVGIVKHEFPQQCRENPGDFLGQALLQGHLMECAAQLTGGYYADPGYKDVTDLHRLGLPISQIDAEGNLLFTKIPGSGGVVCEAVCKEQLLYEIGDPSHYITPDGIADFSSVHFSERAENEVVACGAVSRGLPGTYKVNIGYRDGYMGVAEISYGGSNALARAQLAADIVEKRLQIIGITPQEFRADYIGFNSLYKDIIAQGITSALPCDVRLRIAARTHTREEATKIVREVQCLYINGPAGGGGITARVEPVLAVQNIIIPAADIEPRVTFYEV